MFVVSNLSISENYQSRNPASRCLVLSSEVCQRLRTLNSLSWLVTLTITGSRSSLLETWIGGIIDFHTVICFINSEVVIFIKACWERDMHTNTSWKIQCLHFDHRPPLETNQYSTFRHARCMINQTQPLTLSQRYSPNFTPRTICW